MPRTYLKSDSRPPLPAQTATSKGGQRTTAAGSVAAWGGGWRSTGSRLKSATAAPRTPNLFDDDSSSDEEFRCRWRKPRRSPGDAGVWRMGSFNFRFIIPVNISAEEGGEVWLYILLYFIGTSYTFTWYMKLILIKVFAFYQQLFWPS